MSSARTYSVTADVYQHEGDGDEFAFSIGLTLPVVSDRPLDEMEPSEVEWHARRVFAEHLREQNARFGARTVLGTLTVTAVESVEDGDVAAEE